MTGTFKVLVAGALLLTTYSTYAQTTSKKATDTNAPLHAMQPDYPIPYGMPKQEEIKQVLDKIYNYLEGVTPASVVNSKTGEEIKDYKKPHKDATLKEGDFRLTSYEWGVTYAGMLLAGEATGDKKYIDYTNQRFKFLTEITPYFRAQLKEYPETRSALRQILSPHALDDTGAMAAAMIKAERSGTSKTSYRPLIDNYINYISTKEFRFQDGTLARNRPLPNTLWLDDLFMSVPALAQMGKLTGDRKYYDDAVKQVLQFSERMFNKENNLYMHGWVESMNPHPQFHWARANGWAIMATVELLEVLPEDHPERAKLLEQYKKHAYGIAAQQSGQGFWHQLLDRHDSYLETSATAIFAYSIARGINRGWLDPSAYASMVTLAWNAVTTKVNAQGQVEGTCVGTGMGFEPAFYYYRPISVYAAHGYGPVLLAGAEVLSMLKKYPLESNDSAILIKKASSQ
jgi:rhamnogalacturonyl hydrolase YesR